MGLRSIANDSTQMCTYVYIQYQITISNLLIKNKRQIKGFIRSPSTIEYHLQLKTVVFYYIFPKTLRLTTRPHIDIECVRTRIVLNHNINSIENSKQGLDHNNILPLDQYQHWQKKKHQKSLKRISTRAGFEPARTKYNGLAIHRLNHSATLSTHILNAFQYFI